MSRAQDIENLKNLSLEQVKELTKSKKTKDEILSGVSCIKIDDEWKEFINHSWWGVNNPNPFADEQEKERLTPILQIRDKLLAIAGEEVCLPCVEEDLDNILTYGQLWSGKGARRMRGEASQCHSNSANLWENNKDKTVICTGYALSKDGMWRQHSWLMHIKPRSNQIVETTELREAYFGFAMTYDICEEFVDNNW